MIKSVKTTMFETNKKEEYKPARIILKMPPTGQTISWSFTDITTDNIKCIASWTTVTIDGIQKKAIKVVKQSVGVNSKVIEYYVKGIGLWKTVIQDLKGTTQISDKFERLDYDPTGR